MLWENMPDWVYAAMSWLESLVPMFCFGMDG